MLAFTICCVPASAIAKCKTSGGGAILSSITDICYDCVFPLKIASFPVMPGSSDNDWYDTDSTAVCVCEKEKCYPCFTGMGVTLSYFAPNRLSETVSDPWCFPYYGLDMGSMSDGSLMGTSATSGGQTGGRQAGHTFAQMHWWRNEVWIQVLKQVAKKFCEKGGEQADKGNDIGWISELDPLWNDDELSAIIEPEALLFANPLAQLGCTAQAISATLGWDMPLLFWCIGGQSSYPLTGAMNTADFAEGNQRISSRSVYRMTRSMLLCDTAIDACKCMSLPIWWEAHYRVQALLPTKDVSCNTVGRTGVIWAGGKNVPYESDNFLWLYYRKAMCCAWMQCLCG